MAEEGLKLSVHEMETSVLHPDKIADGTVGTCHQKKRKKESVLL